MKIILFSIVLAMSLNTGCGENILKKVSIAISKEQLKEGLRKDDKDYYHGIRTELIKMDSLDIFQNSETLFFLETYEYESGTFYGKIWNTRVQISYTYNQGVFNFGERSVFSDFTCELIERWDIEAIRKEENENPSMNNPFLIYGTRVIMNNQDLKVDCIGFNEIFLLERDN